MGKLHSILKAVLKDITPTKHQKTKLERLAKKGLKLAKKEAKKYNAKAILAGSIIRDTWLPDKLEFDIFILFPEEMNEEKIEKFGLKIGEKTIKKLGGSFKIEYAEHPYVSGEVEGVKVDLVPCYELKSLEKIKSAVDRTPFHVKYLEKNLSKQMAKEVRLLKQFMKANEIYGADAKTEGFSGYACELLIIHYKKFLNVLKAALKWKAGEIIDLEKFYEKKDYQKLKSLFRNHALILIDPVDKNRNTTAALSIKNFFKVKKISKDFLENPNASLFKEKLVKPMNEEEFIMELRERKTEIIAIKFSRPRVIDDIIWPQLRKFAERIDSILREYGFRIIGKDVFANEKNCYVIIEFEVWKLPDIEKRIGPIVFDLKGSESFKEKYKEEMVYIEGNRWVVERKRKFQTAKEKIIDSLKKPVEILKAKGIPSFVAEEIAKDFSVHGGSEVAKLFIEEEFAKFVRKYFEKEKLI